MSFHFFRPLLRLATGTQVREGKAVPYSGVGRRQRATICVQQAKAGTKRGAFRISDQHPFLRHISGYIAATSRLRLPPNKLASTQNSSFTRLARSELLACGRLMNTLVNCKTPTGSSQDLSLDLTVPER